MSKLKVAKAVHKSFAVAGAILGWTGLFAAIALVVWLLWLWANAHFLSFAIVIGIVVGFFVIVGLLNAWDWSKETIEKAEQEEREEHERERAEKRRASMPTPKQTVPTFEEEFYR
jgi:hypothetical protein